MVHIVKLGYRGVAGLEHLDVQLPGNDLQLFWADLADQPVHQVAPGPEAVVGVASNLGQPCHGALKGMRVQVGHAGDQGPGEPFGPLRRSPRLDTGHVAIAGDLDADMAGPAAGQQGTFGEVGGHGANPVIVSLYIHIQAFACRVNCGKLPLTP